MNKIILAGVLVSAMAVMVGCETAPKDDGAGSGDSMGGGGHSMSGKQPGVDTSGADRGGKPAMDPLDDPNSLLAERTIYFDFDSSSIREEYRDVIAAHAEYLANHSGKSIALEGHADERGSREYNIALGERRAGSVSSLMSAQGARLSQMDLVSYGEERPLDSASNESAWAKNRRVEIVYQ